jgi:hypothetical protein
MASNHAYLQLLENFLVNLLTQKSSQINTKVLLLSGDTAMRLPPFGAFGALTCGPACRSLKALTVLSPHSPKIYFL